MNEKETERAQAPTELSEDAVDKIQGGAVECFLDLEGIKGESTQQTSGRPAPTRIG